MSTRGAGVALVLLAVAVLPACGDAGPPEGSGPTETTAGETTAGETDAEPPSAVLGELGQIPRSLVVASDGRVSVLLTSRNGSQVVTVQGLDVVRSVPLDAPVQPTDLVLTRDGAGDEVVTVVAEGVPRTEAGEAFPETDPVLSLFAVSGGLVEERPLEPEAPASTDALTRAVASPDGRTLYVVTSTTGGASGVTARVVDPDTGGVRLTITIDPGIEGLSAVDQLAVTAGEDGSVWVAVSGPTTADASGYAAALVQLSADLTPLSVDPLPSAHVDALTLDGGTPDVVLFTEGADTTLSVVQPTSERGDRLLVSRENLHGIGVAVSGETIAVAHEGVAGAPALSLGSLGGEPRGVGLCDGVGDSQDVAAAPGSGFYVSGTCVDEPRLWQVE